MKWEYKILDIETSKFLEVKLDTEDAARHLNELGRSGWELVAVTGTNAHGGRSLSSVMIFKRPLGEG